MDKSLFWLVIMAGWNSVVGLFFGHSDNNVGNLWVDQGDT